jgi:hypothetical protein
VQRGKIANQAMRVIEEIAQSRGKVEKTARAVGRGPASSAGDPPNGCSRRPWQCAIFREAGGHFEPHAEIIRKSKTSKPTGFGKMVQTQEGGNQIITVYEVFEKRPWDSELVPAVDSHQQQFGTAPRLVTADGAFYSKANEDNSGRTKKHSAGGPGCEGRISVLKCRHRKVAESLWVSSKFN